MDLATIKILEISVGLGAAAIVIDKVLNWTVRWKRASEPAQRRPPCVESATYVRHEEKLKGMDETMKKLVENSEEQTRLMAQLVESQKRQEALMAQLVGLMGRMEAR